MNILYEGFFRKVVSCNYLILIFIKKNFFVGKTKGLKNG